MFPHKKNNFARPAIILSDRAQVFLQAALRVFNEETYDQFLSRAYRIVTNQASNEDLCKTNIHACLAHFMLVSDKLKVQSSNQAFIGVGLLKRFWNVLRSNSFYRPSNIISRIYYNRFKSFSCFDCFSYCQSSFFDPFGYCIYSLVLSVAET